MASDSAAMRSLRPARRKRSSQGVTAGRWDKRIEIGPMGLISQPGASFHSPGMESGTQDQAASTPALPKEQAVPGSRGSMISTSKPRSSR